MKATFINFYDEANNIRIVYEKGLDSKAKEIYDNLIADGKQDVSIMVESENSKLYEEYFLLKEEHYENH